MTQHYDRSMYDELVEVSNEEAFDMCKRLNREESIIAGPSSGMQVVGAMRLMKDEPGNVGVIIFCDDIFKYTTSCTRHVPSVFPPEEQAPSFEPAELTVLKAVLGCAEGGPDTLGQEALSDLKPVITEENSDSPRILDVRLPEEFSSRLRAKGAINLPMAALTGQDAQEGQIEQVFDVPGAVRKKRASNGDGPPGKRVKLNPLHALRSALQAALGSAPALDTKMLLICNRGVDSLYALMAFKAAGFTAVQHVGLGMFAWIEADMPVEKDPALVNMPPGQSDIENAILNRFGYNSETGERVAK